jgi:hypothetical protein
MAESTAKKELELRLKVVADNSGGNRAMQELAKQTEKVEQAASKAQKALAGVFGYSPGGVAGAAAPGAAAAAGAMPGPQAAATTLQRTIETLNRTMGETLRFDKEQAVKQERMRESQQAAKKEAERTRAANAPGVFGGLAQAGVFGGSADMAATAFGAGNLGGIARIAGAVGLAYQGLRTSTALMETANDPFMTGAQKSREMFRQLPFGETIQGFGDAVSGRKAAFAKEEARHQKDLARAQGYGDILGFTANDRIGQARLNARADQLSRPETEARLMGGFISESIVSGGGRAYQEARQRQEFDRQRMSADIESNTANAARMEAERQEGRISGEEKYWKDRADQLQRELEGAPEGGPTRRPSDFLPPALRTGIIGSFYGGKLDAMAGFKPGVESGVDRQRILNERDEALARARIANEQGQGMARTTAEAREAEAKAEANRRRVGIARLRGEADILSDQAATSATGARKLGAMDAFDRADAIQNLRILQTQGPEALDPDQLASAQALAPQRVGQILEQQGARTREFQELQAVAPEDFAGDPEKLRREAEAKRNEAARQELGTDRDLAQGAARVGEQFGDKFVKLLEQALDTMLRKIQNDLVRGKGAKE